MNDAQLRCFHLTAVEGNVTKAAARLGVSQPTVSAQIKTLEKSYGLQLFRRAGRNIELTQFGEELKAITDRLYAAQAEARELLAGRRNLNSGHLRIGAVGPYHVLPVLQVLRTQYPDVTFSLRAGNSTAVFEALARYDIDIGILANLSLGDRKFHIQHLRRDDIVLLVHRDHPLAKRRIVDCAELADETIIIREQGSTTRSIFLRTLEAAGVAAPQLLDIASREATKEAVACGFGVAPVLHSEAGEDQRCAVVRIAPPTPSFDEFVACPRDLVRNPLIRAFLDAASTVCERLENEKDDRSSDRCA